MRNTLGQANPPNLVQHVAMGSGVHQQAIRLSGKPEGSLASRGDARPTDPKAPGPERALITLAANNVADVTDVWHGAAGHPNEHKDSGQEKRDTLAQDLMDELVQLMSPPEQQKRHVVLVNPSDAPTVTLLCFNHTPLVVQWESTAAAEQVQTLGPDPRQAFPIAMKNKL